MKKKTLTKISKLFLAAILLFEAYALYTERSFWGLSTMELYGTVTFIAAFGFFFMAREASKEKRK